MVAALLGVLASFPAAATAAPGVQRVDAHSGARAYWTPARMRAAEPVEAAEITSLGGGAPAPADAANPSFVGPAEVGAPAPATLRSGSRHRHQALPHRLGERGDHRPDRPSVLARTARSSSRSSAAPPPATTSARAPPSTAATAAWSGPPGHCVYDNEAGGGYSKNFVFVPAYKDGSSPYGEWPAKKLATTVPWRSDANIRYDLAAAVVRRDSSGRRLQDVVGAAGIGFSQPRFQDLDAIGYPADPVAVPPHLEFDG